MDTNLVKYDKRLQKINLFFNKDFEKTPSINEFLELPISILKGLPEYIYTKLKNKFNLITIHDLLSLDIKEIDSIAKQLQINQIDLEKFVIASRIVLQSLNKINGSNKKISLIGLNNAGKTAMRFTFFKKYKKNYIKFLQTMNSLKPTKWIERESFKVENDKIQIWDMGGQKSYRSRYIKEPYRVFFETDVIIYVIDIQLENLDESYNYLQNILEIYNYLNKKPFIIVCLHKFDPVIKETPKILNNDQIWREKIQRLMEIEQFNYKIYRTSIFDDLTIFNVFSYAISKLINKDVKKVLNKFLEEHAKKIGVTNILLLDINCLKIGYWCEKKELCKELYNYIINFLGFLNVEFFFDERFQNIDSIDLNLDRYRILTLTKRIINKKLILFASIHRTEISFNAELDVDLIPWLANLIN
ncbi:MAG: ADP-ribosylation factor-like protein [Candidatus Helarchaeota archaeon]